MTATKERTIRPEFVAVAVLQAEGRGYAKGRLAAGDLRIESDEDRFGDYYAAHRERALGELYVEFVALREEQRAAEEEAGA